MGFAPGHSLAADKLTSMLGPSELKVTRLGRKGNNIGDGRSSLVRRSCHAVELNDQHFSAVEWRTSVCSCTKSSQSLSRDCLSLVSSEQHPEQCHMLG